MEISRQAYAEMYGPTTGDRVRLGDTELWISVEKDMTRYGEEVKFGGGKVIRDGMGQSQRTRPGYGYYQCPDSRLVGCNQGRRGAQGWQHSGHRQSG